MPSGVVGYSEDEMVPSDSVPVAESNGSQHRPITVCSPPCMSETSVSHPRGYISLRAGCRITFANSIVNMTTICLLVLILYRQTVSPYEYRNSDKLHVRGERLASHENKLLLDYYWLPYCGYDDAKRHRVWPSNLQQLLTGERSKATDILVYMLQNKECAVLCGHLLTTRHTHLFKSVIQEKYRAQLSVGGIPVVSIIGKTVGDKPRYRMGYPVGMIHNGKYYVNNHLGFTVFFNANVDMSSGSNFGVESPARFRIVRVEVNARSIDRRTVSSEWMSKGTCPSESPSKMMEVVDGAVVIFTYSVDFVEEPAESTFHWNCPFDETL